MKRIGWVSRVLIGMLLVSGVLGTSATQAQYWVSFADHTRYLALGDSLSAGYGAHPATHGFVYDLYQRGVIDRMNHLLFCNLGVPNATSADVLQYQVPQAALFLTDTGQQYRQVITLTVGGNDLLQVLTGANPEEVLGQFAQNLGTILAGLPASSEIYVANQYDPGLPVTGDAALVHAINDVIAQVVSLFPTATVVDIFTAFEGRSGLLLIEKTGADGFQVHPTDAGYRVMASAFATAMQGK